MSTTAVIIAVLACVFVLIAVTFTLQLIEKNNSQKNALIASLKIQARNFRHMLEGFPEGLLSRDLKLLVCQCLTESLEQLMRLDRKTPEYTQMYRQLQEKITQLQAQNAAASVYQPLTDPAQIQEVQKMLGSLYNVVQRLYQNKRLDATLANIYGHQIQRLTTRIALDTNLAAANQAQQSGNSRLAQHYYGIAIEKMIKDNADEYFTAQIDNCRQLRTDLEKAVHAQTTGGALSDDWKAVVKPPPPPPTKRIYD
jgi:CII-binding regulator of phage lambda lysogenization HflD